jgi:hypothetical protein
MNLIGLINPEQEFQLLSNVSKFGKLLAHDDPMFCHHSDFCEYLVKQKKWAYITYKNFKKTSKSVSCEAVWVLTFAGCWRLHVLLHN